MAPVKVLLNLAIAGTSGYSLYHSTWSIATSHKCQASKAETPENAVVAKGKESSAPEQPRVLHSGWTVSAGVVMALLSLMGALYRLNFPEAAAAASEKYGIVGLLWMPVSLFLAELAVSEYIRSFWADERKAPLVEKFNESVSHNMEVMRICDDLACLWALAAGLAYFGY